MREVVKAVIYRYHKYLLQLRDNDPAISYPNTWSFFGGGVDDGENFDEALMRELEEELSWRPDEVVFMNKSKNNKTNCNISYYLVHYKSSDHRLVLGEGQAMGWYTIDEVMGLNNISDEVLIVIKQAYNRIKSL